MTRVSLAQFIEPGGIPFEYLSDGKQRGRDLLKVRVRVIGLVQGVGFRPFVYRAAKRIGLAGLVRNTSGGVEIELEGSARQIETLLAVLQQDRPPIAEIKRIKIMQIQPDGVSDFCIAESCQSKAESVLVCPDVATCDDCLDEMYDPSDRRCRYPFINCTNCGPRFTIVEDVPYDRKRTTMQMFSMCPACEKEYGDPANRRFHAEPTACPACGPQVVLLDNSGEILASGEAALRDARARLARGRILAVKGLGGFHLACDATCDEAVSELRLRKGRPDRPLAVMCRDLGVVRAYCRLSAAEARELEHVRRPILLLQRRPAPQAGFRPIAAAVAPRHTDLGVLLPYTPLHHLLLMENGTECLVMTSGNRCGEPIVADNRAAVAKLGKIADTLLTHDRSIWNRCDDSVGYVEQQRLVLVRRSRGFVPLPVELPQEVKPSLALGAMSNNTFALAAGRRAYLSQHIGDVDNLEALGFLRESIEKFRQWLDIEPELVAHDLHPDLMTTHLAYELAEGRRTVAVQHHHAHFAAALTAAGITGQAQGLVFDGTGWGSDRTIWGGELLVGSVGLVKRAAHLRPLPLPGGEATVRRPLRMAVAGLHFLVPEAADAPLDLWRRAEPEEVSVVRRMVDRRFNTPPTSSAGRLFDAVAAMLGVCDEVTYEGQAAVELEQLARRGRARRGPALRLKITEQEKEIVLDPEPLLSGLVDALLNGARREDLAAGFHKALAVSIGSACSRVREGGGPVTVVLCGGVFQNRVLTRLTARVLESVGLRPVLPGTIPVNDGGVSLGQILVSNSGGNADGTLREGMVATCA